MKMFQAMDADRDGRVTTSETRAAQKAFSGLQKQRLSLAANMNADKDGFLTREEWAAGHATLAKN